MVRWFDDISMDDLPSVGGKNASLGEMISNLSSAGISVPGGFATTAAAFRIHLDETGLADRISTRLSVLDVNDVVALAAAGREIRRWIEETPLPASLAAAISDGYDKLASDGDPTPAVAVRSSATAEDLPDASFAGQQETYLNVVGIDAILEATRRVFASLYNDRAIAYRVHKGFSHEGVALSAGIQRMARSDVGAAGVAFSIDTESGFDDVIFVTSSFGLGELLVQGAINPDEFYVSKSRLRAGKDAILQRRIGSKWERMVYGDRLDTGCRRGGAAKPPPDVFTHRRRRHQPGAHGDDDRGPLRAADGCRVGEGRRHERAHDPPGSAGDRTVAILRRASSSDSSWPAPARFSSKAEASASASGREPSGSSPGPKKWIGYSQATCSSPI